MNSEFQHRRKKEQGDSCNHIRNRNSYETYKSKHEDSKGRVDGEAERQTDRQRDRDRERQRRYLTSKVIPKTNRQTSRETETKGERQRGS